MTKKRKLLSILLCLLLAGSLFLPALAADNIEKAALEQTAAYIEKTVSKPQVASAGGEWSVIGLARSGAFVPAAYFEDYYAAVEKTLRESHGVLHERKYTEYSRVALALTAIGKDPRDVAGYNLLTPLGDYDKTVWQGLNGPIWALLALDSKNYEIPQNSEAAVQATRQMYVERILSAQLSDGGFSLSSGQPSDPDLTGMALQALSKYQDQANVKEAIEKALSCLSNLQQSDGSFQSWGASNLEGTVQVVIALCELSIPLDDERFTKEKSTPLDALMRFRGESGSFRHDTEGGGDNLMATEQALCALAAVMRSRAGSASLYKMADAPEFAANPSNPQGEGLPGKNGDVAPQPILFAGRTFSDILSHPDRDAIERLAERGVISGREENLFDPDGAMTRAEFCAILVRALGLPPGETEQFRDVPAGSWYAAYVGTAHQYGIVSGVSDTKFYPQGQITRQESSVMLARAAALCGLKTALEEASVQNSLAAFDDSREVAGWARASVAFCFAAGIVDDSAMEILPQTAVKRFEVAAALYRLLSLSKLL